MPYRKRDPQRKRYKAVPARHVAVFLPDKETLVRRIAAKGATDDEFETMYGLPKGTVLAWRRQFKGFDRALEQGRTQVDGDMLFALYRNGIGYEFQEEQAVGGRNPRVMEVKRYKPGEFSAQKYWLNNRLSADWRSRERLEHTGADGGPIGVRTESRNELIDAILGLIAAKPDGKTKPEKATAEERGR